MVSIRIEQNTLMFFDPATRVLPRTRPSPADLGPGPAAQVTAGTRQTS